jgi:hypothetical protein
MRCNVCEKSISGEYFINPLFGENACTHCVSVLDSCCQWCGRFKRVTEMFGVNTCRQCSGTLISTEKDIRQLISETLPIIERHIGPNSYGRLPVLFGDLDPSPHAPHPIGLAVIEGPDSQIRIQQGMPRGRAIGVLAHEYGHMILNIDHRTLENRPGIGSRELVIEEGFCEVMCAIALLSQSSDDARWMSFLMPGNPDPVYGAGFRMMWPRSLELGSVGALLQELTGERHPYRGPSPSEIHDDFVIPDDIAPLVEASTGDRDKGVLRGTALLIKDLPEDTPVGPRLRGLGLAAAEKDRVTTSPTILKGTLRGTGLRTAEKPKPDSSPARDSSPTKGTLRGKGLDKT